MVLPSSSSFYENNNNWQKNKIHTNIFLKQLTAYSLFEKHDLGMQMIITTDC